MELNGTIPDGHLPENFTTNTTNDVTGAKPEDVDDDLQVFILTARYLTMIIVAAGVFGNLLALLVFFRKPSGTSADVYFQAMTVVDIIFLVSFFLKYVDHFLKHPVVVHSSIGCPLVSIVAVSSQLTSAWILCGFSVDRMIAMRYPLYLRSISNKRKSITYVAVVAISSIALSLHSFWTYLPEQNCARDNANYFLLVTVFQWIRVALYSIIPSIVICVCNVLIISSLSKSKLGQDARKFSRHSTRRQTVGVVKLLIGASIIFLSMSFALSASSVYYQYAPTRVRKVIQVIIASVQFINHAANFFLYVLSGSEYRRKLKSVFGACAKKWWKRNDHENAVSRSYQPNTKCMTVSSIDSTAHNQ